MTPPTATSRGRHGRRWIVVTTVTVAVLGAVYAMHAPAAAGGSNSTLALQHNPGSRVAGTVPRLSDSVPDEVTPNEATTINHDFPKLMGVSVCPSRQFVKYMKNGRIVVDPRARTWIRQSSVLTFRNCTMPGENRLAVPVTKVSVADMFRTNGFRAPFARPYPGSPVESFCVVASLPGACEDGVSSADCQELGGLNVLSRFRAAPGGEQTGGSKKSGLPHLVFLLVDSVSWDGYTSHMPLTRAVLRDLLGDRGDNYVENLHSNSLGYQSAINHAGIFIGAGEMPEKCAKFKTSREGIPRSKDGSAFAAYQRVAQRVYSSSDSRIGFDRSWLSLGGSRDPVPHSRLRSVYYPIPQPAWEASCLKLFDEDSWYDADIADVVQWRFFNEAVNMANREVNGSQGCIGHAHSIDYLENHVEDAIAAAEKIGVPATVLLAEQTPHQAEWVKNRAMEYFDRRLAATLESLHQRRLLENAVILLAGDHGLSFKVETRAAMLDRAENVLRPVVAWSVGAGVKHREVFIKSLRSSQDKRVSHFDLHATLLASFQAAEHQRVKRTRHEVSKPLAIVSLIDGKVIDQETSMTGNRSCENMGVFHHACRFFDVRPLSAEEQRLLLEIIGTYLQRVNTDIDANNAPCHRLELPQSLSDHTAKLFDRGYMSASASFRIREHVFRLDTVTEKYRPKVGDSKALPRLNIRSLVRVTPYKSDEQRCGFTLAKLGRSNGKAGLPLHASNGPVDVQFCLCKLSAGSPRHDLAVVGFVGA